MWCVVSHHCKFHLVVGIMATNCPTIMLAFLMFKDFNHKVWPLSCGNGKVYVPNHFHFFGFPFSWIISLIFLYWKLFLTILLVPPPLVSMRLATMENMSLFHVPLVLWNFGSTRFTIYTLSCSNDIFFSKRSFEVLNFFSHILLHSALACYKCNKQQKMNI